MREFTKGLAGVGIGLLISSILIIDVVPGLIGVGIIAFAYMYDPEFRRKF